MARIRASLTYANVIATIALFLALGGGAYAALKLPKNSVGSKQLKKNSVTGSKVKNGSLAASDFKAGKLPRGPRGPQGLQGSHGAAGRDGAAIVARVRSTGSVETAGINSDVSLPLTSNTWTQAAHEIDLLPYGSVKVKMPDSSHCGGGLVDYSVKIYVDGVLSWSRSSSRSSDSSTVVFRFTDPAYLYEPGSAAAHTVTAKFSSQCDASPQPAPITVSDLTLDVIRAT